MSSASARARSTARARVCGWARAGANFPSVRARALPLVTLRDRRGVDASAWTDRRWLFQLDLERVLYGNEASTGAAYRLLVPEDIDGPVMSVIGGFGVLVNFVLWGVIVAMALGASPDVAQAQGTAHKVKD